MLYEWFIYNAFALVTGLILFSLFHRHVSKTVPPLELTSTSPTRSVEEGSVERPSTRVQNGAQGPKPLPRTHEQLRAPDSRIQPISDKRNACRSQSESAICAHCQAFGRPSPQHDNYELRQQESDQTIKALTRKLKLVKAETRVPAMGHNNLSFPDEKLTAPYPTTAVEAAFENWRKVDPSEDFLSLDSSISSLATSLHRHANDSTFARHIYQALSDTCSLIEGVPYEKWTQERSLLFRGVIWDILVNSILSHPFVVFGERSSHLTEEWCEADSDHESATWRMLTAKRLLIKAGIVQIYLDGSDNPSNSLEQLLNKSHTVSKSISLVALHLRASSYKALPNKMALAREHAEALFESSDELARHSLHKARDRVVYKLTKFAEQFTERNAVSMQVLHVVTRAQMLALRVASHGGIHHFIFPILGRMYRQLNAERPHSFVSRVRCCNHIEEGRVLFTVRPGLRLMRDPQILDAEVRYPALVYLDGNKQRSYSTVSFDDLADQTTAWSTSSTLAEDPNFEATAENPYPDLPISPPATINIKADELCNKFIELSRAIQYRARSISLRPVAGTVLAQHMIFCPDPTSSLHKPTHVEAAIWGILFKAIFKHPFAIFGDTGNMFLKTWATLYRPVGQTAPQYMIERNNWRLTTATQLLDRIGGEALINYPFEAIPVDDQLFKAVRDHQTLVAKQIEHLLLNMSSDPLPDDIETIVQKAFLLSLKMALHKGLVELWHPARDVHYTPPGHGQKAFVEVVGDSPGQEGGRVTVVVQPGLRQFGDDYGNHLEKGVCLVPTLVHIADSSPDIVSTQPSVTPTPAPAPRKARFAFVEDCEDDDLI